LKNKLHIDVQTSQDNHNFFSANRICTIEKLVTLFYCAASSLQTNVRNANSPLGNFC